MDNRLVEETTSQSTSSKCLQFWNNFIVLTEASRFKSNFVPTCLQFSARHTFCSCFSNLIKPFAKAGAVSSYNFTLTSKDLAQRRNSASLTGNNCWGRTQVPGSFQSVPILSEVVPASLLRFGISSPSPKLGRTPPTKGKFQACLWLSSVLFHRTSPQKRSGNWRTSPFFLAPPTS